MNEDETDHAPGRAGARCGRIPVIMELGQLIGPQRLYRPRESS